MGMSDKTALNGQVEQILKLSLKLVKPDVDVTGKIAENPQQLNAILNGLNTLAADNEEKSFYIQERTDRLNKLVDLLLKYTMMDFSEQMEISNRGDEIDAVALGLNTLGEELDSHIKLLEASEERFRLLIEGVKDYAIFRIDANGYVVSWNLGAERIKGYKADEIVGKHISTFYTEEEIEENEPAINLQKAKAQGSFETEGWRVRKDGSRFWANVLLTALYDRQGNLEGFSKITRDITSKRNSEIEILEKTEKLERSNKQLEQFVYIASHDLQEPLRTLSNYVNLFQEAYKDNLDETSSKHLAYIGNSTTRMQSLVRDLLEYARIGQEQDVVAVNCNILVNEVLNDLAALVQESEATIEISRLPVIYGHYSELKSIFQNLIGNAIKFRKSEGPLVIQVSAETNKDEWVFAVRDNGIGIEKQYQERIFSVFQKLHSRKQYPGSGIGLAHCKKIVELHNGKIWVESEPGKGSIFYFSIPKKN